MPETDLPVPPPPAPPARGREYWGILAFLFALLALGVAGSQPWWAHHLRPAASSAVDHAAERAALLQRLAALEQRPLASTAAPDLSPRFAELQGELRSLREGTLLNAEEAARRIADLQQETQSLRAQLAKMGGLSGQRQLAQQALLASSLQLLSAWQQGKPFTAAWQALVAAAGEAEPRLLEMLNDRAAELLPLSDAGLPDVTALVSSYPAAAQALRAALASESSSWRERLHAQLDSLVSVRRTGLPLPESADTTPAGVLARAQSLLEQRDVAGAVMALGALGDLADHPALSPWLAKAQGWLAAQALGNELAALSASWLKPEPPEAGAP